MNFEEFTKEIEKEIRKKTGLPAEISERIKNNGIKKVGIIIDGKGSNIAPMIYLEEYYDYFKHGMDMESVIEDILEFSETVKIGGEFPSDIISDYDSIKNRIIFCIINTQRNEELLKEIPHREIEDLSIIYKVVFENSTEGNAMMRITNEHMEVWKVSEEDLWKISEENTNRIFPAEFFTMTSALTELTKGATSVNLFSRNTWSQGDGMYVLSNQMRSDGAACLMYLGVLERIAKIIHRNYYILPSSVHEVIVLPDRGEFEVEELNKMIKDINESELDPEDILSDHCYKYLAGEKMLVVP